VVGERDRRAVLQHPVTDHLAAETRQACENGETDRVQCLRPRAVCVSRLRLGRTIVTTCCGVYRRWRTTTALSWGIDQLSPAIESDTRDRVRNACARTRRRRGST
jgi:hypothetical protein